MIQQRHASPPSESVEEGGEGADLDHGAVGEGYGGLETPMAWGHGGEGRGVEVGHDGGDDALRIARHPLRLHRFHP